MLAAVSIIIAQIEGLSAFTAGIRRLADLLDNLDEFDAEDYPDTQLQLALQSYKEGRFDDAWRELNDVAKSQPSRLDVQGYLQLVRNERAPTWAKEIGDQGRVLRRRISTAEIMKLTLKPDEGLMLAQVDGRLSIGDLISLSTSDRVRTLEVIAKLLRDQIIE